MNKINAFIVVATADNISKMTSEEIQCWLNCWLM
jgi:hypothetical protein